MERMFNDIGYEVTKYVTNKRTTFVESRAEALKLTEKIGYFYTVFDVKKNPIGYGIPN
jgi:hypothetical protein